MQTYMKTSQGIEINPAQFESIERKFKQNSDGCKSPEELAQRAGLMIGGEGAIVVEWCGMFLAIETDGHCHT